MILCNPIVTGQQVLISTVRSPKQGSASRLLSSGTCEQEPGSCRCGLIHVLCGMGPRGKGFLLGPC